MAKSVSVTLQYIYPKRLESKTIPNMVTVVVVEINLIFLCVISDHTYGQSILSNRFFFVSFLYIF